MDHRDIGRLAAVAALAISGLVSAHAAPSPAIPAAIADPSRPPDDRQLDAQRKPADLLAFAKLKPGQVVVDVFAGPYFDRLFADIVGPSGKVYMFIPSEAVKVHDAPALPNGATPIPGHANIIAETAPIDAFSTLEPVDLVWIRQNYHDLYDKFMGPADVPAFNYAVFKALKPGGLYIVVDHAAPDGSGLADTDTTHRIDPAVVKRDVLAAGFVFDGESRALRNSADPRTALVFDKSIRGRTDQFVYRFRKPN